ncbi:MAG TPA: protein kinase, partial [Azonexus sp.]
MAQSAFWKAERVLGIALTLVALAIAAAGLLFGASLWIPLAAASLLLVGHLLLRGFRRRQARERGQAGSPLASAASNRMLALAYQGQGQLDLAFETFRLCPMDDGLMENLYNLALDYERRRQFDRAEAVFRTMAGHDPGFRDIARRLSRSGQPSAPLPGAGAAGLPMLGRYRLAKELGKGAMGVVYLGHDPQSDRMVAIKTMALAQEFEAGELAEVKQRFFREAETAGRLSHPNIITMFEAGEERDLAYIAMEFIEGNDLVPLCKPGHLLPLPVALSIAARVADALDYAHA